MVTKERLVERQRPDIYALQARQKIGVGYRDCFVVASQVREGETRVVFKVLEYDYPPKINVLGSIIPSGITRQDPDGTKAAQFERLIREGSPMVKERIRQAIR